MIGKIESPAAVKATIVRRVVETSWMSVAPAAVRVAVRAAAVAAFMMFSDLPGGPFPPDMKDITRPTVGSQARKFVRSGDIPRLTWDVRMWHRLQVTDLDPARRVPWPAAGAGTRRGPVTAYARPACRPLRPPSGDTPREPCEARCGPLSPR